MPFREKLSKNSHLFTLFSPLQMTNMWRPHAVSGLHSVQYNISYSWGQQFSIHNDFIQAMMRAWTHRILSFWISRLSFPNWTNSCWHVANGWGFDRLVMAVIAHSRCQTGDGEQQCVFANRFSAIWGEQEKTFAEMGSIVYASGKKKKTDKWLVETLQQEVKNSAKLLINVLYIAQYGSKLNVYTF